MNKINYLLILFKLTINKSRYKKYIINKDDFENDKYVYINKDLKKGFHKSINVTINFSFSHSSNNNTRKENPSIKNKSESLNQILSKPITNYDSPTNFESFQSTKTFTSEFNKSQFQDEEDTFCSFKNTIFELESFSIKNNNIK